MTEELMETLRTINAHYGKGTITEVLKTYPATTPSGTETLLGNVTVKLGGGGQELPGFYVYGNKVTFRGVTRNIGYKPR